MEHGAGVDIGGFAVEMDAGDGVHRVPDEIVVAQHHAFGFAGGASGVEKPRESVAAGADVLASGC